MVERLRNAARYTQQRRPFAFLAGVILPDHVHVIWHLPEQDADYSNRWKILKTAFSRQIPGTALPDGSRDLWQPRFWEHAIRDEADYQRHLDYIHYNPVKHGWAAAPRDWPQSSFQRYVRRGWYPQDWGLTEPNHLRDMDCE
jgi:putative transposase